MGKTAKEVYTWWKKKESWTSLELGKYFNVCYAQEFVLAALVIAVVTGFIGIFLGFDFREGVPQVKPFALQDKSQALPNKCHKQTPVFGSLDHRYLLQGKLMFPLKPVMLFWTVLNHWVWSTTAVNCSGQRCKHPSPLEIASSKQSLKNCFHAYLLQAFLLRTLQLILQWSYINCRFCLKVLF